MALVLRSARPVLKGGSGAQNDLIAFHSHFVGSKLFLGVEPVLPACEIERPVVPWASHHRAVLADVALAQRGALVNAWVGERVDLSMRAKHRDRSRSGPECATLAFGNIV